MSFYSPATVRCIESIVGFEIKDIINNIEDESLFFNLLYLFIYFPRRIIGREREIQKYQRRIGPNTQRIIWLLDKKHRLPQLIKIQVQIEHHSFYTINFILQANLMFLFNHPTG